jgi:beta-lactamase superfamily II metal-dependent hydrolase
MIRPLPLRLSLILAALLTLVLGALLVGGQASGQLRVLLPAIPGDAALIATPDGQTVLIDGGSDGAALATWLGNTLPFGQRHLDALILSRADAKTLPGQLAALKRYRVGTALMAATERRNSSLDAWWELLQGQAVTPQQIAAGDRLALGRCSLDVLSEYEGQLTLALRCGATTVYFLQSIEDESEQTLAAQQLEPAAIVVYPWKRATDTPLMRQLQPTTIVFSEGGRAEDMLSWTDRQVGAARLYHEATHGQIELRGDERQTTINPERGE